MADESKYPDGNYDFMEVKDAMNKDFANERELSLYVQNNIELFCQDCLGVEYLSHKTEVSVSLSPFGKRRTKGDKRVDLLIKTRCGKSLAIEFKNPVYSCELHNAIGQCLSYLSMAANADIKIDTLYIVATKLDWVVPNMITQFNLPLEYIVFDKDKHLTFKHGSANRK